MKVRLTTDLAGPTGFRNDGEIHDLPREDALALLRTGQAEPVVEPAERATRPAPENATNKRRSA